MSLSRLIKKIEHYQNADLKLSMKVYDRLIEIRNTVLLLERKLATNSNLHEDRDPIRTVKWFTNDVIKIVRKLNPFINKLEKLIVKEKDHMDPKDGVFLNNWLEELKASQEIMNKILGRDGELLALVESISPDWSKTKDKIREVMGDSHNPGLYRLINLFKQLSEVQLKLTIDDGVIRIISKTEAESMQSWNRLKFKEFTYSLTEKEIFLKITIKLNIGIGTYEFEGEYDQNFIEAILEMSTSDFTIAISQRFKKYSWRQTGPIKHVNTDKLSVRKKLIAFVIHELLHNSTMINKIKKMREEISKKLELSTKEEFENSSKKYFSTIALKYEAYHATSIFNLFDIVRDGILCPASLRDRDKEYEKFIGTYQGGDRTSAYCMDFHYDRLKKYFIDYEKGNMLPIKKDLMKDKKLTPMYNKLLNELEYFKRRGYEYSSHARVRMLKECIFHNAKSYPRYTFKSESWYRSIDYGSNEMSAYIVFNVPDRKSIYSHRGEISFALIWEINILKKIPKQWITGILFEIENIKKIKNTPLSSFLQSMKIKEKYKENFLKDLEHLKLGPETSAYDFLVAFCRKYSLVLQDSEGNIH